MSMFPFLKQPASSTTAVCAFTSHPFICFYSRTHKSFLLLFFPILILATIQSPKAADVDTSSDGAPSRAALMQEIQALQEKNERVELRFRGGVFVWT